MQRTLTSSWSLFKQSWHVLCADKHLVILPVLSTLACLVVLVSFVVPAAIFLPDWNEATRGGSQGAEIHLNAAAYIGLFAFYLVNFFVITFFNTALVACASNRFQGKDSSLRAGLGVAVSRLPQILQWALLSATVGMVLRAVAERAGLLGSIVIRLVGMGWAIATYFAVPVLALEGLGPFAAVKRSVEILRKNWGQSLTLHVGLGLVGLLLTFAAFVPLVAGVALSVTMESWIPGAIGGVVTVLCLIVLGLVTSTLRVIIQTALYRFVVTGTAPEGFDPALLQAAIRTKK